MIYIEGIDMSPCSGTLQRSFEPLCDGTFRRQTPKCPGRRGITTIEVIVAFTLLSTVLSAAVPLVVRHRQLLADHRSYRLALDELSNQLDRLTMLPEDELQAALEELNPSELTARRLPGAKLSADLEAEDLGQRIAIHISWDGTHQKAPLTLVGWVFPRPQRNSDQPSTEAPQ